MVAFVASVSVRFQSKQRKEGNKPREKWGDQDLPPLSFFGSCSNFCTAKTESTVPRRSSVFLCSETTRQRLIRRLDKWEVAWNSQSTTVLDSLTWSDTFPKLMCLGTIFFKWHQHSRYHMAAEVWLNWLLYFSKEELLFLDTSCGHTTDFLPR